MDKGTLFIGIVIGSIAIIMAGIFSYTKTHEAEVFSFEVNRPHFELVGRNLSRVEIWAMPTGTGIDADNAMLLAGMNQVHSTGLQLWQASIPSDPLLVTTIFIRAYDMHNRLVSEKILPYTGATEIYDALWNISRPQS